jgi:hypothetical protein
MLRDPALVVTYGLNGATAAEHADLAEQLAPAFDAVPGLVSRAPLQNQDTGRFGAFYVFATRGDFDRFAATELYAATHHGPGLTASDFAIVNRGGAK